MACHAYAYKQRLSFLGLFVCYSKYMYKIIKDKFQKNRGGTSRILDIACDHCGSHLTFYQKDGPGM